MGERVSELLRAKGKGSLLAKYRKTIVTLFAAKKRGKNRKREGATLPKCPPDIFCGTRCRRVAPYG